MKRAIVLLVIGGFLLSIVGCRADGADKDNCWRFRERRRHYVVVEEYDVVRMVPSQFLSDGANWEQIRDIKSV